MTTLLDQDRCAPAWLVASVPSTAFAMPGIGRYRLAAKVRAV